MTNQANMAHTPRMPNSGLSKQGEQLVKYAADPTIPSISEAGRRAGYGTPQSTHRALKTAEAKKALAIEKRRQAKHAQSALERATGMLNRSVDVLESFLELSEKGQALTFQEARDLVVVASALRKQEADLRNILPEVIPEKADDWLRQMKRDYRVGRITAKAGVATMKRLSSIARQLRHQSRRGANMDYPLPDAQDVVD